MKLTNTTKYFIITEKVGHIFLAASWNKNWPHRKSFYSNSVRSTCLGAYVLQISNQPISRWQQFKAFRHGKDDILKCKLSKMWMKGNWSKFDIWLAGLSITVVWISHTSMFGWADEFWFLLQHSDCMVRIWHKHQESIALSSLVLMPQAAAGGTMV